MEHPEVSVGLDANAVDERGVFVFGGEVLVVGEPALITLSRPLHEWPVGIGVKVQSWADKSHKSPDRS
jgi:hypothetical protein